MSLDSLEKLFLEELKDIYNAEKQLIRALPADGQGGGVTRAGAGVHQHLKETEGQVQRLERIFKELGQAARGKKCKGNGRADRRGQGDDGGRRRAAGDRCRPDRLGPEGRALRDRRVWLSPHLCRAPGLLRGRTAAPAEPPGRGSGRQEAERSWARAASTSRRRWLERDRAKKRTRHDKAADKKPGMFSRASSCLRLRTTRLGCFPRDPHSSSSFGQRCYRRLEVAGQVALPPQRTDQRLGLLHLEPERAGRLHRVIDHGLLGGERLHRGPDAEGKRLGPGQPLLGPLELTLPGLEPLERLLGRLELVLGGLQHRPGLLDLAPGRPDGLDVFDGALGQVEHVLDLGLDRLDTGLAGQGLLQRLGRLGLSRLPLREQLLEVRQLPVDVLEGAGTGLQLTARPAAGFRPAPRPARGWCRRRG